MKFRYNNLGIFIFIYFILFSAFIYISFKPHDYIKEYNVDKYNIKESYDTKSKKYQFIITSNNELYVYEINNKYNRNRALIDNIKIYKNKEEICILPESKKINFYPLCNKDKEIYSYNLSKIKTDFKYLTIKNIKEKFENLEINYLNNNAYLLFNYRGFLYINKDKKNNIQLFNKDVYNLELVFQTDNYLVIPDYNQNFYFDKLFVININTGKVTDIKLEEKLSFEGIFLGEYKGWIYYLDKKEKKEYKINIKNNKLVQVDFVILKNGKLEEFTYNKILNNDLTFDNKKLNQFIISDNILYKNIEKTKIKVSNNNITKIIKEVNDTVYYLSDNNLYMYNDYYGEVLLISNFEWNFNNTNMIFFY